MQKRIQDRNFNEEKTDHDSKIQIGNLLLICRVEGCLGYVNWIMNIAKELKRISTAQITYLFEKTRKNSKAHLR